MNPKSKKVLADQGSQVAQAFKWIGGALFGDAEEVLDEMAEREDEAQRVRTSAAPRAVPPAPPKRRRAPPPPPEPKVIDADFEDEDDE